MSSTPDNTRRIDADPDKLGSDRFDVSKALHGVNMGDYTQALEINGTEVVVPGYEETPWTSENAPLLRSLAAEAIRNNLVVPDDGNSVDPVALGAARTVASEIWKAQAATRDNENVQWSDFGRTYVSKTTQKRETRKKWSIRGGIAVTALAAAAIATPIVESFNAPTGTPLAQDKPHSASDPNADRKGPLPNSEDGVVIAEAPEVLQGAKEAAEKEVSEAGRAAANTVLDYLAAEASMTVPYETSVLGGTNYNAFGNQAYNLSQQSTELRVPEAFISTGDAPNKIDLSVIEGTASTGGWSLVGSVSQTITINEALSKELYGKLSRGESLTLTDFRKAVNDPDSTFSTTASTDSSSTRGNWSGDVENAPTSLEVVKQKNAFTEELDKAMDALNLVSYTK